MPGMEDFRRSILAIAIVAGTCVAVLVPYLLAYRFTGKRGVSSTVELQVYEHSWQASLFKPAASIESYVRGTMVFTAYAADGPKNGD